VAQKACVVTSTGATGRSIANHVRAIAHPLSHVTSGGGAASLLAVTELIAYRNASLFEVFSCPDHHHQPSTKKLSDLTHWRPHRRSCAAAMAALATGWVRMPDCRARTSTGGARDIGCQPSVQGLLSGQGSPGAGGVVTYAGRLAPGAFLPVLYARVGHGRPP
jgi:hypothetical protein